MRGLTGIIIGASILLFSAATLAGSMPDHDRTPGVTNPTVTQANIGLTICVAGWTATIRPPSSYTTKLKRKQIGEYHFADKKLGDYEEDHLISLELGGSPDNPRNLWPEAYAGGCGARVKDRIETKLKRLVCSHKLTLAKAQRLIATDWKAAFRKYVDPHGCTDWATR